MPRRAVIASLLSAVTAGGVIGLLSYGQLDAVAQEQFQFSRGTTFAAGEATRLRGFLSTALADDRVAVVIIGHTGSNGDQTANLELSTARAEAARTIATDLGLPPARLTVTSVGGADPLARMADEADRAYQSRLARVTVSMQVRR